MSLSPKEELFCQHFATLGDPLSAATKAGFSSNKGVHLLANKEIRERCNKLVCENLPTTQRALKILERLASGSSGDVALLLRSEELTENQMKKLDLFHVSKINYSEKGIEITFFDRQKAIETLLEYTSLEASNKQGENLLQALEQSAKAVEKLGDDTFGTS